MFLFNLAVMIDLKVFLFLAILGWIFEKNECYGMYYLVRLFEEKKKRETFRTKTKNNSKAHMKHVQEDSMTSSS